MPLGLGRKYRQSRTNFIAAHRVAELGGWDKLTRGVYTPRDGSCSVVASVRSWRHPGGRTNLCVSSRSNAGILAPKRGHMRITFGFGLGALILLGSASVAQAQVYGPYTFDANSWVTSATQTGFCDAYPSGMCAQNVVGHSPSVCAANIQCTPDNYIEMFFGNTTIVNNPGVDLVVFDTRFSTDAASIAVETAAGTWTPYFTWNVSEQFILPNSGCAGQTLVAVPVDLSRFGLPLGFSTKRIRVGGNAVTGSCQFDLTMVGVPIGSPMCVTNTDCNDGNPCTNDACSAGTCSYTPSGASGCGPISVCGNGLLEAAEGCDDGNAMPGDGCSNVCQVEMGYECMAQGMPCTDIDECESELDNCDDNASCHNTPGSFMCACFPGYEGDGVTCIDIDECALNTDNCDENATCTNTPGSFTCMCNAGYEGTGDACTDIDECTTGTDNCDMHATCTNMPGSFTCTCHNGFYGDGIICTTVCGDGFIAGDEKCDDGNTAANDGCNASCIVEDGWTCGGAPSVCESGKCGDGQLAAVESCDDANIVSGDGCSGTCAVEPNWVCEGQPSVCTKVCADGQCNPDPAEEGSCECSMPGQRNGNGAAALGIGLAALAMIRARRTTKRAGRRMG